MSINIKALKAFAKELRKNAGEHKCDFCPFNTINEDALETHRQNKHSKQIARRNKKEDREDKDRSLGARNLAMWENGWTEIPDEV